MLYISAGIFFLSCKDEFTICDQPTAVRMKCGLYQNSNGVQTEVVAPFLTVTLLSFPTPDYSSPGLSKFSLALNPLTDSVKYQISVKNNSIPDTVTFIYSSQQMNISALCGDVYINNLTRINTTMNTLDSVKIYDGVINTTSGENVRIYF